MIKLETYFNFNQMDEMRLYIKGGEVRTTFNRFVNSLSWSFKNGYIRENNGSEYYYKNAIYYDNRTFIIIYNGMKYYLDLDEETINNYEKGEYNAITRDLKELIDLFNEELKKEEEKEKRDKIVENAKKGIFPNTESKVIYRDYLIECHDEVKKIMEDKFKTKVIISLLFLAMGILIIFLVKTIMFPSILAIIELIAVAVTGSYLMSIAESNEQYLKEYTDMIANITNSIEQDLSVDKQKEVNVSKDKIKETINYVTDKLKDVNNKDKIIILEKLKRVLELSSLNEDKLNDNIMLRLNIIKQNLKYFESREENTYIADKPKRKVLRPNINNISKKTFTRG